MGFPGAPHYSYYLSFQTTVPATVRRNSLAIMANASQFCGVVISIMIVVMIPTSRLTFAEIKTVPLDGGGVQVNVYLFVFSLVS
jgi:hypothetical protein